MKIVLAILITAFVSMNAWATDFCRHLPFDPESPAGLSGSYEIIGKDVTSGSAYFGRLTILSGKRSYAISRTVNGNSTKGQAWLESCRPDNIQFLATLNLTKPITEARCRLGGDGDNYFRMTCYTSDRQDRAWS